MKKDNKGFTLVELIVVIVILGILAAILVPALLGYIDKAKNQQDQLNAKTCLTAVKSELADWYGKGLDYTDATEPTQGATGNSNIAKFKANVKDLAELGASDKLSFKVATDGKRAKYTIDELYYKKGGSTFYLKYSNSQWEEVDDSGTPSSFPSGDGIIVVQ